MKRFLPLLLAISVIAPFAANAQDVREANYQFKQDNYQGALKFYMPAYKKDTGNVDMAYAIGICKIRTNANPAKRPLSRRSEDFCCSARRRLIFGFEGDEMTSAITQPAPYSLSSGPSPAASAGRREHPGWWSGPS